MRGPAGRLLNRASLQGRLARFTLIGIAGFVVDAGTLQACVGALGISPYLARLPSFVAAASFTWWLNRNFTFPPERGRSALGQWARFMAANAAGACLNYAVFAGSVALLPGFPAWAVLGVALGSLAGLALNFTASERLVFARQQRRRLGQIL